MTNEEWKESFLKFLESRPKITDVYFDLDVVSWELVSWGIEQVQTMYGDKVNVGVRGGKND